MKRWWAMLSRRNRIAVGLLPVAFLLSLASAIGALIEGDVGQTIFSFAFTVFIAAIGVVLVVSLRRHYSA